MTNTIQTAIDEAGAKVAAEAAQEAAETAETNAETAETNAETAQSAAESARDTAQPQDDAETAKTGSESARDTAKHIKTLRRLHKLLLKAQLGIQLSNHRDISCEKLAIPRPKTVNSS